jgi:hypothetical protein
MHGFSADILARRRSNLLVRTSALVISAFNPLMFLPAVVVLTGLMYVGLLTVACVLSVELVSVVCLLNVGLGEV